MGAVSFNRAAALQVMTRRADAGVEVVAGRVMGLAKSLAPVRKTDRYQRKTNRSKAATMEYFKQGTNERVAPAIVLQKLREEANKGVAPSMLPAAFGRGSADRIRALQAQTKRVRALGVTGLSSVLYENSIELRFKGDQSSISYRAKSDAAKLHGVHVSATTGRASFGGTLRKSIRVYDKKVSGKRVARTVKAAAPYAKYVEFPTSRTKAQPFLLPAFKVFGTVDALAKAMKR